jgi:chromosome segregation ATPase
MHESIADELHFIERTAMSDPINPNQRWEVRDASGQLLGYFVPGEELERRLKEAQERIAQLEAERAEFQQRIHALTTERDAMREERDGYLSSLYALTRKEVTITEEDIRDIEENGMPLSAIIVELEKKLKD